MNDCAGQIDTGNGGFVASPPMTLFNVDVDDEEHHNRYLVTKDGLFLLIVKNEGN